ncbi:helix-turn-helix domain-containing protein [Lachnospiraceae bacterium MD329]|nr:helix-turn-helix domain-containing protein [Lachnospiraceae bacterium MD329]
MTLTEKQHLLTQITVFINNLAVDDENKAPNEPKINDKVELLTVKECAKEVSGLSECTVRQLVTQGKLPHIRSGAGKRGKILIPKAALLEYFGG